MEPNERSRRTQILITATAAPTSATGREIIKARLEAAVTAALAFGQRIDLADLDVAVESGAERADDMLPEVPEAPIEVPRRSMQWWNARRERERERERQRLPVRPGDTPRCD